MKVICKHVVFPFIVRNEEGIFFSQEKYENPFTGCVDITTVIPKKTVTAFQIHPQYLPWICYKIMVNSHIKFYCFRCHFNRKSWCYG